jgi:cytochrome c
MRLMLILIALFVIVTPADSQAQLRGDPVAGKVVYEAICATCHTLMPPPKLAPPMAMVSRHYREAFANDAEGVDALFRFISAPDTLRMTMPKHVIARFGVMPKFALSEKQVRDVSRYVWSLSAPEATAPSGR